MSDSCQTPNSGDDDYCIADEHLPLGSVVVDSEQSPQEQDEAIVVATPDATIDEWDVYEGGTTVADDNPEYPPADLVTIIVFRERLKEQYPYYSGVYPLYLPELNQRKVPFYSFPTTRLTKVGMQRAHEIPIDSVFPSPYHSRSFGATENNEFISETAERGFPIPYPLIRVIKDADANTEPRFEILDGHKRVWVAHVAGCRTLKAQCVYVDDAFATGLYLQNHYHALDQRNQTRIEQQIRDRFDDLSDIHFSFNP